MPNDLVTIRQLCKFFQISSATLWRRRQEPGFPTPYRIGRLVRFSLSEVALHLRS